jgi:hypothetical protein
MVDSHESSSRAEPAVSTTLTRWPMSAPPRASAATHTARTHARTHARAHVRTHAQARAVDACLKNLENVKPWVVAVKAQQQKFTKTQLLPVFQRTMWIQQQVAALAHAKWRAMLMQQASLEVGVVQLRCWRLRLVRHWCCSCSGWCTSDDGVGAIRAGGCWRRCCW